MKRARRLLVLAALSGCTTPATPVDAAQADTSSDVGHLPTFDTGPDAFVARDAFTPYDASDGCSLTTYPTLHLSAVTGTFNEPLAVVAIPGSTDMAVVEHGGHIQIMHADGSNGGEFVDLHVLTNNGSGEQGLLGLAFHPDYVTNGLFYFYYAPVGGSTNVLAMGHRSTSNPSVADPATTPILTLTMDMFSNHNGGNVVFGPDGLLYVGTGDGGSGGDPMHHGQDTMTWYAKILRLRVGPGIATYEIPPTNPFATTGGLPEIYAYGVRNPWRFSFDRWNGDLYIGDVGQDAWEEVDVDTDHMGGDNYGWNICEGTHSYGTNVCSTVTNHHAPIFEYPHTGGFFGTTGGASITGGVVYRGTAIPALYGTYLFAEEVSSQIGGLRYCGGTARDPHLFDELGGVCTSPASFGEDHDGNVYVACVGDNVMRLSAM